MMTNHVQSLHPVENVQYDYQKRVHLTDSVVPGVADLLEINGARPKTVAHALQLHSQLLLGDSHITGGW